MSQGERLGLYGAMIITGIAALWFSQPDDPAPNKITQPLGESSCVEFMLDYYSRGLNEKSAAKGEAELWRECTHAYYAAAKVAMEQEWQREPMSEQECGEHIVRSERCTLTRGCFNSTREVLLRLQCTSSYVSARSKQSQFIQENYPN